jgi:hypothetical protein
MTNLRSDPTISELIEQLKTANDEVANAYNRAQKESIKSELSQKANDINATLQKAALAIDRVLLRGVVTDNSSFLLSDEVATDLKQRWDKAVTNLDRVECTKISDEIKNWASEAVDDVHIRWSAKLTEIDQHIRTSIATIAIVKPDIDFTSLQNRLKLLKLDNGGYRSINEIVTSLWDMIVEGQSEVQKELDEIQDIPDHVMDFLRRRSVSLAEFESDEFQPTREWIAKNPGISDGLLVKWGN